MTSMEIREKSLNDSCVDNNRIEIQISQLSILYTN
jgi:hypothetical protein